MLRKGDKYMPTFLVTIKAEGVSIAEFLLSDKKAVGFADLIGVQLPEKLFDEVTKSKSIGRISVSFERKE